PGGAQRIGGPLRGTAHVGVMLRERADARDREVLLQLLDVPVTVDVDEVDDLIHGSMICHAFPSRRTRPSRSSFTRCDSTPSCASGTSGSFSPRYTRRTIDAGSRSPERSASSTWASRSSRCSM